MCLECGFYKGRMVMDLAAKKAARTERIEAKKAAIQAQNEQIDPTEADTVAETLPEENKTEEKAEQK